MPHPQTSDAIRKFFEPSLARVLRRGDAVRSASKTRLSVQSMRYISESGLAKGELTGSARNSSSQRFRKNGRISRSAIRVLSCMGRRMAERPTLRIA